MAPPSVVVHKPCIRRIVATEQPGSTGTPGDRNHAPSVPDQVWQKFLEDSERVIRDSAPREPSALERSALSGLHLLETAAAAQQTERQRHPQDEARREEWTESVGELWQPEDLWTGPTWREMDGRAKLRRVGRVGRVLGTVAAVTVILGAASRLPTGSGNGYERHGDATQQQWEESPDELPTGTAHPSDLSSTVPSSLTAHAG